MTGRETVGRAVRPLAPACPVKRDSKTGVENLVYPKVAQPLLFTFDVVLRIRNAESYQRKKNRSDVACTQCLGVGCPADAQCSPSIIKTVAENTLLRIALRIIGSPFGG